MLQNKPTDPTSAPSDSALAPASGPAGADPMQVLDAILGMPLTMLLPRELTNGDLASPEFQNFDSFDVASPLFEDSASMAASPLFDDNSSLDSFLTSPMQTSPYDDFSTSPGADSPFSEFLTTPILPSGDDDLLTGPLIEDVGFGDDSLNLFGGAAAFPTYEVSSTPKLPPTPEMYTFSPGTPPIDSINPSSTIIPGKTKKSASAPAGASASTSPSPPPAAPRRRSTATGTRKNLKPESLLGMEAPTQRRTYAAPSATSRKVIPAVFAAKKRLHSAAFPNDGTEEEQLQALSPTASEKEAIEHKRRQNTLAARKSRKRKLEHQQMLEDEVTNLNVDRDKWKARALLAQQMLRDNGITLNYDDD
ncbi:BZIP domain-containing protein [Mycena kentingensis (nom. inval.)]|nr:BZIP domain-containing protein [Mycena kentingensis (nom. inval.)]